MRRTFLQAFWQTAGIALLIGMGAGSCSAQEAQKNPENEQGGRSVAGTGSGRGGAPAVAGSGSGMGSATGGTSGTCPTGQTDCPSGCADLNSSESNCGMCGIVCPEGATCEQRNCVCQASGLKLCGDGCVDLQTSSQHCGSCNKACGNLQVCQAGMCVCGMSEQGAKLTLCGAFCRDTTSDPLHCGACNAFCSGTGKSCVTVPCGEDETRCTPGELVGRCECQGGLSLCSGACVSLESDPENCGQCGTACPANTVCSAGQCSGDCEPTATKCDQSCTNLQTDPYNCGECGKVCVTPQCVDGSCACSATELKCGSECVDILSNPAHCGKCETQCGTEQLCENKACVCKAAGLAACGQACVDLQTEPKHCGACDRACGSREVCQSGTCVCAPGDTRCSGVCVDLTSNANHCGRCGTVCTPDHICDGSVCQCRLNGTVRFPECPAGGACADTTTDSANCGGCGIVCPPGSGCIASTCTCNLATHTLCKDLSPTAGPNDKVCVDTKTDWRYCGSCTIACGGATNNCCAGTCTDVRTMTHCGTCGNACAVGSACCGSGVAYACADLSTDAAHCGSCTTACPVGQICRGGVCGASCPPNVANGVKVQSLLTDYGATDRFEVQARVCNTSTNAALSLAGMKLKYWYSYDGTGTPQTVSVSDAGGVGATATVAGLAPAKYQADYAVTVTLASGSLAAGQCMSGTIRWVVQRPTSFSIPYALANDWSYLAPGTTLADNHHLTAYDALGTLVWGIEAC
jgi:hypothetical protein